MAAEVAEAAEVAAEVAVALAAAAVAVASDQAVAGSPIRLASLSPILLLERKRARKTGVGSV